MKKLSLEEQSRYKAELEKLPIGSISRKKIAGKTRYYRQWAEDGRTKSVYLKESEVEDVRRQIERRRELVKLLRPYGASKKRPAIRDSAIQLFRPRRSIPPVADRP